MSAGERAAAPRVEDVPAHAYWHTIAITPGDIDEQGHVNNAVYVRWMDRAAVEHSAALGWGWSDYARIGAAFVVRRHEIDYLHPALLADGEVLAATWPTVMARATAERRHLIVRRADRRPLVRAVTRWAFVDVVTGRPVRIPREVSDAFPSLAQR